MSEPPIADRKAQLRRTVRARRSARAAGDQAEFARGFAEVLLPRLATARSVTAYLALPGEPDLGRAMDDLAQRSVTIWLPVVSTLGGERALVWGDSRQGLVHGAATPTGLRLLEPAPPHVADPTVDVVLLPGLAVDRRGVRMGQGAGYYDRTAQRLGWPSATTAVIAIVHDDEVVDEVPAEPHDLRATAICTPTQWIDVAH